MQLQENYGKVVMSNKLLMLLDIFVKIIQLYVPHTWYQQILNTTYVSSHWSK